MIDRSNTGAIRTLADQIEARAAARDPFTPQEMHQIAATLRVFANKYERPADVLQFPMRRVRGGGTDGGSAA